MIDVPGVPRFEIAPHRCFACGTLNTHGLGLVLHVEPDRSWVELALESRFEGWEGIAHGGIICTILDEVMAWALVGEDNWGLTARMSVEFHKPVAIGMPIRAEGRVTRSRRRLVDAEAVLTDVATGAVLASATGVYVAAPEDRKQELRARYGFRPLAAAGTAAGTPASADGTDA
ncbi:MAG TPA: PaaI family thioesterase [Candidatus Limnocylindrales bacterium]